MDISIGTHKLSSRKTLTSRENLDLLAHAIANESCFFISTYPFLLSSHPYIQLFNVVRAMVRQTQAIEARIARNDAVAILDV